MKLWLSTKKIHNQLLENGRLFLIAIPYGWLVLFFCIPFCLIFKISFTETAIAIPPIAHLSKWVNNFTLQINLNLENYWRIMHDTTYISALFSSIKIAFFATIGCLLIGYPIAYSISMVRQQLRPYLLLLIALPFWTSFLIRAYAWMALLNPRGLIASFLNIFGIENIKLLDNDYAVCLGIVYCYLPFMIFPIYAVLSKIQAVFLEAAFDLGCSPWQAFWRITVPLSLNGIYAGSILVFIPSIGEFVLPELLGGADTLMIGRVLWWEFFNNRNWSMACALAVVMLLIFVLPIMIFQKNKLDSK